MRVIWEVVAIDKVMVLYSVGRMRVFKVIADKEGLLLVLQCFFHLDELGLVWTLEGILFSSFIISIFFKWVS